MRLFVCASGSWTLSRARSWLAARRETTCLGGTVASWNSRALCRTRSRQKWWRLVGRRVCLRDKGATATIYIGAARRCGLARAGARVPVRSTAGRRAAQDTLEGETQHVEEGCCCRLLEPLLYLNRLLLCFSSLPYDVDIFTSLLYYTTATYAATGIAVPPQRGRVVRA